ncbi:MAG: (2Fe-2S)-binding protein [Rhodospirillales bacterium]|nr:(2Fe-2S)-binding protein [Rhodospirillales bacterium]
MGTTRFVAPGFSETIRLQAAQRQGRTLLAIALEHGIPILFNCEAGGCGACIVHVESGDRGVDLELTFEEEFLLRAMGKLEDGLEANAVDGQRRFRLACQYVVGNEDIIVDFTNELGGA